MKTHTKIIVGALAVTLLTGTAIAVAHDRDDDDHHKYRHGMAEMFGGKGGKGGFGPRMLMQFDADGDGKVTTAEVTESRAAKFTEFDANGDGALTLTEYELLWQDAMRERMVDRFQHHDDDGNGQVTLEEFNERFARMAKFMDRDGDGDIDADDRPRRRHHD